MVVCNTTVGMQDGDPATPIGASCTFHRLNAEHVMPEMLDTLFEASATDEDAHAGGFSTLTLQVRVCCPLLPVPIPIPTPPSLFRTSSPSTEPVPRHCAPGGEGAGLGGRRQNIVRERESTST